jgi:hypothetical protein
MDRAMSGVDGRCHESLCKVDNRRDGTPYRESGERKSVEMPKRVKPWWVTDDSGKLCLVVKYGTKPLETLQAAVSAGVLDAQIEAMCGALRKGFVKR